MKIVIISTEEDYFEKDRMSIDGKERLSVGPLCECPEDAIIGRDLVSCNEVLSFMEEAYKAGKQGEELIIERKKVSPEKYWD